MGLPDEETSKVHLAGLVHDIGKIGLSAGLLEKPGALTLDERREMQRHSEIGERILAKVDSYAEIASIVRHHHERVDGGGYPDGLTDEEIPLLSRIIAVADAYNAMTSDRPYRDAMPSRVARLRLAQAVDSQFDTSVVAAFEAVLAMGTEPYRMATSPEFTFEWQLDEAARTARGLRLLGVRVFHFRVTGHRLCACPHAEFLEDVVQVALDGPGRDEEARRNSAVCHSLHHVVHDLALANRKNAS